MNQTRTWDCHHEDIREYDEERDTNIMNWKRNYDQHWIIRFWRHSSSSRDEFWTKFSWLFVTSVIKIWITKSIISTITSKIIWISRFITSRSISRRKSISSSISETIISWIINNKKFSQTIILIFISIRNSENTSIIIFRNFSNVTKSLQRFIISIEKFLHSSFIIKKEVNA